MVTPLLSLAGLVLAVFVAAELFAALIYYSAYTSLFIAQAQANPRKFSFASPGIAARSNCPAAQ